MSATVTEPRQTLGVALLHGDTLDSCVQCGMCLTSCPTYRECGVEMDSPRGRIALMKLVREGRGEPDAVFARHISLCLGCRACETVCPAGVPFGALLDAARAVIEQNRRRNVVARLARDLAFRQLLPHPARLRLLGMLLRQMERLGLLQLVRRIASGRVREALQLLPDLSVPPYLPGDVASVEPPGVRRGRVALFWGCLSPVLLPNVQRATVAVLSSFGYEVVVPDGQTCCGALHLHQGLRDDAQALARRNLAAFEAAGTDAVIVNAAGCGAALKAYPELLCGTAEEECAAGFGRRVYDFAEFLATSSGSPEAFALKERVTYQEPCHLAHGQRLRSEPRQLLKAIPGVEFTEMPEADRCCGSAGIYNLLHPELSRRLRQAKISHAAAHGAGIIVTANPGCQLHLQAGIRQTGFHVEVLHVAELLVRAYGIRPGGGSPVSKPTASKEGGLRTIIVLKALYGILFLLVGLGIFALINKDLSDLAARVADSLGIDPENRYLLQLLEWLTGMSPRQIITIGLVSILYSGLLLAMAWGLHLRRAWADWLTISATGLFIPIELYEVARSLRLAYVIALVINASIIWYLIRRRIRLSSSPLPAPQSPSREVPGPPPALRS